MGQTASEANPEQAISSRCSIANRRLACSLAASKFEQVTSDPESMRLWKRFQRMTLLPERDQRAVIRLIN